MARKQISVNRKLHSFARAILTPYLDRTYGLRAENIELIRSLTPPYVILPNHSNNWDPFLVHRFVSDPIYYVASDNVFRKPLLRFVLGLVGAISKSKAISDYEAIKNIMHIKNNRGIIGIFPEGQATWDGRSLPMLPATAKLLKVLKVPVVVPILHGAFLARPRWKKYNRRGRVTVSFTLAIDAEEIKKLSVDEIEKRLADHLRYDESEHQRNVRTRFKGRDRAEYLESILFTCPQCGSLCTTRSKGNNLSCTACGFTVYYNEYGLLEERSHPLRFDNLPDWNEWQVGNLKKLLTDNAAAFLNAPVFTDTGVTISTGYRRRRIRKHAVGVMSLYSDRISFSAGMREGSIDFPLGGVEGVNIQTGERLEFYHKGILYRIEFAGKRISAFKWLAAVKLLHGEWPLLPRNETLQPA